MRIPIILPIFDDECFDVSESFRQLVIYTVIVELLHCSTLISHKNLQPLSRHIVGSEIATGSKNNCCGNCNFCWNRRGTMRSTTNTTGATRRSLLQRDWFAVYAIFLAGIPEQSSSFVIVSSSQCGRVYSPWKGDHRVFPEVDDCRRDSRLWVAMQNEEELLASIEDGSIDIDALQELLGEDFDIDSLLEEDDDVEDSLDEDSLDEEGEKINYVLEEEEEDEMYGTLEERGNNDNGAMIGALEEEEAEEAFEEEKDADAIETVLQEEAAVDYEDEAEEDAINIVSEGEVEESYEEKEDEDVISGVFDGEEEVLEDHDQSNNDDQDREEKVEAEVDEMELIVKFLDECMANPVGGLDVSSDAELIRELYGNIPLEASSSDEPAGSPASTLKASYTVENLLHRFVDEWRDAIVRLEEKDDSEISLEELKEREQIFRPQAYDYHKTIVAISKDEKSMDDFDVKAERIFELASEQRELVSFLADHVDPLAAKALHPNHRLMEIVLESLSQSSERGVDRKASTIFNEWLLDYGLTPSPAMYAPYIKMIARARNRGAARKADAILREAISKYPPDKFESPIGVDVFNTVVTSYAKARGESNGPQRAQELIIFMDGLDVPGCAPNAKTFTSLVDAYAQTNEWEGVSEAQTILNNLLNQYLLQDNKGGKHLEPSVATWTIVMSAWMRLSKKGRRGAAKRAGDLLQRMESLSSQGRISFKPDAITYVTVFNAYAGSKFDDEVEKAEELLEEMNERYLDGDDTFQPTVRSIKTLIDSWIKIGEIRRAEEVLNTYQDILEDAEDNQELKHTMSAEEWQGIYKSLLIGHAKMDNPKRAIAYLNLMIENDDTEPDSMCYERIMDAYYRLEPENCAKKAQALFKVSEERRQAGKLVPNERVFTTFIRNLIKSKVPGLHKKADLMLQRMHSLANQGNVGAEPSIFTYNAVLNACSESAKIEGESLQEAFQTSVRVFTQLRKEMDPDHVTFANMIRCARLLESESQRESRDKFVTATFKMCRESGNVNNYVLRNLSKVASKEMWESLTGLPTVSNQEVELNADMAARMMERLPPSWSENCPVERPKSARNRGMDRQRPPSRDRGQY